VKALTRAAHQMLQRMELVFRQRQRDPVERDVQAWRIAPGEAFSL
jgi:hypothetical protein